MEVDKRIDYTGPLIPLRFWTRVRVPGLDPILGQSE